VKGFPNQVAELPKIATGIRCLVDIETAGRNGKDDGVLGEALVRAGVAGTGHTPTAIDEYLEAQLRKPISGQSFRTTARGLRELYRLMGLIDDSGPVVRTTELGKAAAAYAGQPWNQAQIDFWRRVISNIEHSDDRGTSHPYQILLRLVARKPGITRAKSGEPGLARAAATSFAGNSAPNAKSTTAAAVFQPVTWPHTRAAPRPVPPRLRSLSRLSQCVAPLGGRRACPASRRQSLFH